MVYGEPEWSNSRRPMAHESGPLIFMMPIPPVPMGVAMAAMVSSKDSQSFMVPEPLGPNAGWAYELREVVCFLPECSFLTGKTTTLRKAPSPLLLVRTLRSFFKAK